MKRLLTSTACAIFICGTACAREVTREADAHPSWVSHLCHTSRRAINQRRRRDRRTLHDGVHFNPRRQSGCVVRQAFAWRHGVWSRRMALRIVSSLRITATRATFFGRPQAVS